MWNTTVVTKLRPKTILIVAVLLVAGGIWVASRFASGEGKAAATLDAARGISWEPWNAAALPIPVPAPHIVVQKAQRKLFLYSGEKLVRTYRIGLGLSPVGNKVRQGDRRTPEGD